MPSISNTGLWVGFFILIVVLLSIDYFSGGKKSHVVTKKEALIWSVTWFGLAILFDVFLWWHFKLQLGAAVAHTKALQFFTGYLIEKSLSVDNIFLFLVLFSSFQVPLAYQKRVLLFGVLGAVVLRLVMILIGVQLVQNFHWILYVFGAFIVFVGIRLFFPETHETTMTERPVVRWMQKHLRIKNSFVGERFWVKENGRWYATRLLLVLVLLEVTDLIFALDSIPAIFSITQDAFIIFTSNVFAIFGLRALYFLLADLKEKFHTLKYGLAIILMFVGVKMLIEPWVAIPIGLALGVVVFVLLVCILYSIFKRKK